MKRSFAARAATTRSRSRGRRLSIGTAMTVAVCSMAFASSALAQDPDESPTECSARAADYFAEEDLLPYAVWKEPRYYEDISEYDWWYREPVICKDLTGDGDREMIVWLRCCTGGSLSPWAIYEHNEAGQWEMAYGQVRNTVWQLKTVRRTVRTMQPSPYEGACTRYVRWKSVWWNGQRFRSKLGKRRRIRNPC